MRTHTHGDADEVDVLDDAISDLGEDLTSENVAAVGATVDAVRAAARGVVDSLADC